MPAWTFSIGMHRSREHRFPITSKGTTNRHRLAGTFRHEDTIQNAFKSAYTSTACTLLAPQSVSWNYCVKARCAPLSSHLAQGCAALMLMCAAKHTPRCWADDNACRTHICQAAGATAGSKWSTCVQSRKRVSALAVEQESGDAVIAATCGQMGGSCQRPTDAKCCKPRLEPAGHCNQ